MSEVTLIELAEAIQAGARLSESRALEAARAVYPLMVQYAAWVADETRAVTQ